MIVHTHDIMVDVLTGFGKPKVILVLVRTKNHDVPVMYDFLTSNLNLERALRKKRLPQ